MMKPVGDGVSDEGVPMRRSGDTALEAAAGRAKTNACAKDAPIRRNTEQRIRGQRKTGRMDGGALRACRAIAVLPLAAAALAACTATQGVDATTTASIPQQETALAYSQKERDCLERAIFFEANRTSEEGLVAVGTVVMNRVESEEFPDTVCGVVGQKNQFAPGVLSRSFPREKTPDIQEAAEKVLAGYRHPKLDAAKYFHMAGLSFPYRNMHYRLEAGGNAFYERH